MELRHLRYFVAVADHGGFGQASRALSVAQSAISEQVRDLETELGVPLFDRSNRHIALTAYGEQFLNDARGVLASAELAINNVQRALRGEIGTLTIGFFSGGIGSFFPPLIKDFRQRFPGVRVALVEMAPGIQYRALQTGTIDIGFTRAIQPSDSKLLSAEKLQTESIYAVLPPDHRFAKRKTIFIRELAEESFILNDRKYSPAVFDKAISLCSDAGFSPALGAGASVSSGVLALVQAGEGIGILPQGARSLNSGDLVFVPLADPTASIDLVIAWSPFRETPLIHSFLDMARKRPKHEKLVTGRDVRKKH